MRGGRWGRAIRWGHFGEGQSAYRVVIFGLDPRIHALTPERRGGVEFYAAFSTLFTALLAAGIRNAGSSAVSPIIVDPTKPANAAAGMQCDQPCRDLPQSDPLLFRASWAGNN